MLGAASVARMKFLSCKLVSQWQATSEQLHLQSGKAKAKAKEEAKAKDKGTQTWFEILAASMFRVYLSNSMYNV